MFKKATVKTIHLGGSQFVESLQIDAGDPENQFSLAQHGSKNTNSRTWTVSGDETITKVELSFSTVSQTLQWIKFTTNANNFCEIGTNLTGSIQQTY